jgi:transcriptional repressor NrdR
VPEVHCPSCSFDDTKVIDSRLSEEGGAIRRRRSCTQCGYRFTTYERLEEVALNVVKRGGGKQPFDRLKMMSGIQAAVKGRPVSDEMIMEIAERIEDALRLEGGDVTSNQVGHAVLEQLRLIDEVAYMRFASVYKNFDDAADFKRELALLEKHASSSRA